MARFVNAQVPEVVQPFWAALQRDEFIADAAAPAGTYEVTTAQTGRPCQGAVPAPEPTGPGKTPEGPVSR
jgi:hypothetical protein